MAKDVSGDQKKTGFESKYNGELLRKLIKEGKDADQILEELQLASRQSLRQHLLKLITTDNQVYIIKGLDRSIVRRPSISQKGDVRISKKMMEFPGSTYKHGDEFRITSLDNEQIVLTRIVPKSGKNEGKSADESTEKVESKTAGEPAAKTDGKPDGKGSTK